VDSTILSLLGVASVTFYTLSFWGLGHVAEHLTRWLRGQCFQAMLRRDIGW
jgi:hypothetical protein